MWSRRALSPTKVSSPLKGELLPNVLKALSELEDRYSFGPPTGAQGLTLATETEVSGALGPGETLMDLDVPVEGLSQDLASVRPLGECSLSSCPDSGTDD